jgi:transposase-like protein
MLKELNKKVLQRVYVAEGKSTYTIAKIFGCSHSTVQYRCRKYGIRLRPSQKGKLKGLNRETLDGLYTKEQKSIHKIAKILGCSTSSVIYRCRKYGIKIRPRMKEIKGLTKAKLQRLYIKEGKSISRIAEIFSCSHSIIEARCKTFGIKLRSPKRIKGLNKSTLYRMYVTEGKTVRAIAKIMDCSREPVRLKCKQFAIPLRPPGNRVLSEIDKSTLRRMYIQEGKTITEIAKIFGCVVSTISQRVKRVGLKAELKK